MSGIYIFQILNYKQHMWNLHEIHTFLFFDIKSLSNDW